MTFIASICKRRELREPGPGTYKIKDDYKIKGPAKIKGPQLMMLGEVQTRSKETPAAWKYKMNYVSKFSHLKVFNRIL